MKTAISVEEFEEEWGRGLSVDFERSGSAQVGSH